MFTKTKLKKAHTVVKFITLSLTLLFYAAICGFSPSIVRAITLCLVSYIMRSLGGSTDGLNTLGVAAIIILFFTPSALFEVGFQLSFAACFGIILFARRIGQVCDEGYKFFQKLRPRRYTEEEKKMLENGDTLPLTVGERFYRAVTSVLSASLAAQILTAPIQYLAFGYFSGWSFILNLFFVPLISAVFASLLVLVLLACILPFWLSAYLLYIPVILLNVALLVFEIADFSSFLLVGVQLSGASCVCYYGGALFLTDKWNISKGQQKWLANGCFLCFFVILALLNL
jgi:competence protein ComEC